MILFCLAATLAACGSPGGEATPSATASPAPAAPRLVYLWPADGPADLYALDPASGEVQRLTEAAEVGEGKKSTLEKDAHLNLLGVVVARSRRCGARVFSIAVSVAGYFFVISTR